MSFLRLKWSWPLLPTATIALTIGLSAVRAEEEKSNRGFEQFDDVDVAKVQAGGKIVLISSGPRGGGFRAIDDDHRTTFRFASDDPRPTLIVQLVENRPIHRVSTVTGSKSEKIDVYLFNELPKKPQDLDELTPVGTIIDPGVAREASLDFAPQNARYVALRWTLSGTRAEPLNVAEVCAFTHAPGVPVALAEAAADPSIYIVAGPPILPPISP
jgi:hypothetical protein